jgi:hypothetical protein
MDRHPPPQSPQTTNRTGTLTRSDMEVDSRTWTTCIVGKVSEWLLGPLSSPDARLRLAAEAALKQVNARYKY